MHGEIILKSMSQTKGKCDFFVLSRSHLWMVWRYYGIPRVHCYYFCLEPTVRKDICMITTSVTVMVIFFKISILKFTWSQLCSKFLLNNIERHIENIIVKDTLQLNNLQAWINIRAKFFIKTSVNVMKQKSMKVPGKIPVAQKSKCELRRILNLNRPSFTSYTLLFLSNTIFTAIYLPYLPFD